MDEVKSCAQSPELSEHHPDAIEVSSADHEADFDSDLARLTETLVNTRLDETYTSRYWGSEPPWSPLLSELEHGEGENGGSRRYRLDCLTQTPRCMTYDFGSHEERSSLLDPPTRGGPLEGLVESATRQSDISEARYTCFVPGCYTTKHFISEIL